MTKKKIVCTMGPTERGIILKNYHGWRNVTAELFAAHQKIISVAREYEAAKLEKNQVI